MPAPIPGVLRRGVTAAVVAAAVSLPLEARAQITTVSPTVVMGMAYDDNLFWAPADKAVGDVVWHVTPGLSVTRESARLTWFGTYTFDAERYRDQQDLTTPFARQDGSMFARFRPTSTTTVEMRGGYDSTVTPLDFNLTTGLGVGRISASQWYGGPEVKTALGASMALDVVYQLTGDSVSSGDSLVSQAADVTLTRKVGSRYEERAKIVARQFVFNGSDRLESVGAMLGWKQKLTPSVTWTISAGPILTGTWTSVAPEIGTSIARHAGPDDTSLPQDRALPRHAGFDEASLSYDRTQTTAVGLVGVIDTQRLLATTTSRFPGGFDTTLQAAAYLNQLSGASGNLTARVYQASAELMKHFGAFAVAVSYGIDMQRGLLGTSPLVVVGQPAEGVSPGLFSGIGSTGSIRRNVVLLRMLITPQVRPLAKSDIPE